MALLQDIIGQLADMGFGAYGQGAGEEFEGQVPLDYMSISQFTPSTISQTLQNYFGLQQQDLPAHMFQGISSDILQAGLGKTYSPQVEAHGSSLLSKLREKTGGEKGKRAFGGFAGSGQQQSFAQSAKDVYGKSMGNIFGDIAGKQQAAQTEIANIISGYGTTASGLRV